MKARKITPQDTFSIFIGSGALSYPWYEMIAFNNTGDDIDPPDNWSVTFELPREFEENEGQRYTLDHASIMRTVHKIVRGYQQGVGNGETRKQCRAMLNDVEDCDFDANSADCVLQAVAFNDVVYC